ncbi:MAG: RluA family pseudouridine synthase, partial [Desulfuromonas sp.]
MRLDHYLAGISEDLSRTLVRKVIQIGGVHVAGRRVRRSSTPVKKGEQIELYLDALPLEPFVMSEACELYRDPYLLALNKPAGIETQPTPARYQGTLYAALLTYLKNPQRPQLKPELGMAQRLDRETSGVMVFSIHKQAHRGLTEAVSSRQLEKRYLALVQGSPPAEGEFRSLLARNRATNRVRSVRHGGKEAMTRYRRQRQFDGAALVEIELLTGRSHQIRAHFSEAGFPLLGDQRYDGPRTMAGIEIPRQMLHSASLRLNHPVGGKPLLLQAPLPDDFTTVL